MPETTEYLNAITATKDAYYDSYNDQWLDMKTKRAVPAPSLETLRTVSADQVLQKLTVMVPELERLLGAYREQTIDAFVRGLLDRVKDKMPDEIVQAGQALIRSIVRQQEESAATKGSSFSWTLEKKVEASVDAHLASLVTQELEKQLKQHPDIIRAAVDAALKGPELTVLANNLVSPKLMKLVEELRLEITAGAARRNY